MEPIDELYQAQNTSHEPGVLIAQISADALKVIENLRQDHSLLCEELTLMEQIAAIPNVELRKVFLDQRINVSDDKEMLTNNNFLRMQTRRRLDEVAFCHEMSSGELKTHLERSIVLGDCLLCEWFVRSEHGIVAL